ncbi:hypothetical protein ADUPG1_012267 [Aduncisulcus paluster]|uniref:Uncharacterized protein n=1 Tax=Aduncisulcus paluster TaxID=2918883 RepID=A0ABQ5K334_9EUKA|nr:hypothetical protein ADUPG1_012267 [Aduncisulcus paluster]
MYGTWDSDWSITGYDIEHPIGSHLMPIYEVLFEELTGYYADDIATAFEETLDPGPFPHERTYSLFSFIMDHLSLRDMVFNYGSEQCVKSFKEKKLRGQKEVTELEKALEEQKKEIEEKKAELEKEKKLLSSKEVEIYQAQINLNAHQSPQNHEELQDEIKRLKRVVEQKQTGKDSSGHLQSLSAAIKATKSLYGDLCSVIEKIDEAYDTKTKTEKLEHSMDLMVIKAKEFKKAKKEFEKRDSIPPTTRTDLSSIKATKSLYGDLCSVIEKIDEAYDTKTKTEKLEHSMDLMVIKAKEFKKAKKEFEKRDSIPPTTRTDLSCQKDLIRKLLPMKMEVSKKFEFMQSEIAKLHSKLKELKETSHKEIVEFHSKDLKLQREIQDLEREIRHLELKENF